MRVLFGSDAHNNYEGVSDNTRKFMQLGQSFDLTVIVGDWDNIVPWGAKKYRGSRTFREMEQLIATQKQFMRITGNHDPEGEMRKAGWTLPLIVSARFVLDGLVLDAIHGHQRALDWRFFQYFAPGLTEWMVAHHPYFWYWVCARAGWLPRLTLAKALKSGKSGNWNKYLWQADVYKHEWRQYVQDNAVSVVIGHDHLVDVDQTLLGTTPRWLLDCGDLETDSTYLVVENGVPAMRWL